MTSESKDGGPPTAEDVFAEYLAEGTAARGAGRTPPGLEEWIARHPQLESALRQLESDWLGFDSLYRGAMAVASPGTFFRREPALADDPSSFAGLEPGTVVGDFRLLERIGQGGMGEVWKAEQISLRRSVALKFIRPDRVSPRAEAFFDREARAGGRLSHPGIVQVHATGREGGLHWIAQELVKGSCSLGDFLEIARTWRLLPPGYHGRVARFMAELCDALQAAHEMGVIHRDVKPHNVLVSADDHPKLTDFGLARLTDEEPLSASYGVKGTPIYMSPEQILGKNALIDHRTDVYSAGAVLYELLTQHRPYEVDSSKSLVRVLSEDPPDPCTLRRETPPELGAIALKALEQRPADRYRTAGAMADDLRAYLDHRPVRARPAGPLRRAGKWVRRHPTATSVLVLALALVGASYVLGARFERAAGRRESAEREVALIHAWRAIDVGDSLGAAEEIETFNERFPDDPQGHLVMVAAYGGSSMFTEMEEEIARLGDHGDSDPALGHFVQAMRLRAEGGTAAYAEVQRELERALDANPGLEVVHYPLYAVRKARGDLDGAREALEAYRETLRTSAAGVQVVDALLEELEGDFEGALVRLGALRAGVGDEEFLRLRGFSATGRAALLLYKQDPEGNRAQLDEAEDALSHAVSRLTGGSGSSVWSNLGLVHLYRQLRTPSGGQRREGLELAIECARRATSIDRGNPEGWEVLVSAENCLRDLGGRPDEQARLVARLREDLDALAAVDAVNSTLRAVRADLLYEDGMALLPFDEEGAYELFEASCRLSPVQLNARVMMAQVDHGRQRYGKALAELRQAEATWEELRRLDPNYPDRWQFTILVWAVGSADGAGEIDLAFDYLERARVMVAEGEGLELAEVCTLAEFLATPQHDELRDCDYVNRLFRDFGLEQAFGADYPDLIEAIRKACPR